MKTGALLFVFSLLALSGCSGLNVSLLPPTKPLAEHMLEGKGTPKILLVDLDGVISFKEETDGLKLQDKAFESRIFPGGTPQGRGGPRRRRGDREDQLARRHRCRKRYDIP